MKKLKKFLVAFLLVLCSFFFVACGEMNVYVNYGSNSQLELTVGKKDAQEIKAEIAKLKREGYEIEGVYTDSARTQKWNGEDITKDMNLYIKWIGKEYQVNFNANGGEGTTQSQTIRYGESANLTANGFTRTGYSFKGWAKTSTATQAEVLNLANFTMNEKGVTLYAVWEVNTYSVSFNANGGTGTMANQNINYGASDYLTENNFEKEGYYFTGWNTKADGTGTAYANGASITMPLNGITLYATWQVEKYNVVIKNGAETIITHENAQFGETYNVAELYGSILAGINAPEGKVYGGLYLESDTTHQNQYLPNLTADWVIGDLGQNGSTVVFVIYWAAEQGTIPINYFGATGGNTVTELNLTYGDKLTNLPTNPTKDGHIFIGWFKDVVTQQGDGFDITNLTSLNVITTQTEWKDNFYTINALWASTSADELTLDVNGGNWDDNNVQPSTHSANAETSISSVSKFGYTFVGWETQTDMIVNGVYAPAGTVFAPEQGVCVIPEKSFVIGENAISLKAKFVVQTHTVTFNVANQSGGYDEILTVGGNSFTNVKDGTNYNEQTLFADMQSSDPILVFDGWYTSNTNFTSDTKYDAKNGKISGEDINVYARYISKLTAPTNINMAQSNTVVSWDAVSGAEYYLVKIDDGEAQRTNVNSFDTGLQTSVADNYKIEVMACSSYESAIGESINSGWEVYNFTREENLTNSILRVEDGEGNFEKYVIFTGNSYTWTSANYTVEVKDLSQDGLVANSQVQVEDKVASTITANTKTGTFKFVINYNDESTQDAEYLVQVVEDVQSVSYGTSYARYLTQTDSETSAFLNKNADPYLVGTANGFIVDFVLTKGEISYTDFDRTNEEVLTYSYEVKDGGVYREATLEEIPERKADGKLYFASANAGKEYRITVSFKYSKNATDSNPMGTLTAQFELKLNNGVNVYTHEELKSAYGDNTVKEINILRNITPELSSDQVQADGSPINVGSSKIFDNNNTTSSNATVGTERKTDGNIYKRSYMGTEYANDSVVVNGNYLKIDASQIKLVNPEYSSGEHASSNGVNNQVGLIESSVEGFTLLRPHIGVFYYSVPFGQGATFNNLEIAGNKPTSSLGLNPGDEGYDEAYSQRLTEESGSYSGFYIETSKVFVNNSIIYNMHHGIRMDGVKKEYIKDKSAFLEENWDSTVPNNAKVEVNYVIIREMNQNAIYSWEGKEVRAYNSYFADLNGPAIQVTNDGTPTQPIVVIDKNTVVDNYMTGNESWFSLWGLSTLAAQLKAGLQPVMENMGASVLSTKNQSEATNLIFIFEPKTDVGSDVIEDGTEVPNQSNATCCTVYFGGERAVLGDKFVVDGSKVVISNNKLIIDGDAYTIDNDMIKVDGKNVTIDADRKIFDIVAVEKLATANESIDDADYTITINYTRSTGVKTYRDYTHFASGDQRISGGMHAFGVTPFADTASFSMAAAATQDCLNDSTSRSNTIMFALGGINWDTMKQTTSATAGGYTLEQLGVTESQFKTMADVALEYAIAREVVKSYIANKGLTSSNVADHYQDMLVAMADAIGKSEDATVVGAFGLKFSQEYIAELCKIHESSNAELISFSTIQQNAINNAMAAGETDQAKLQVAAGTATVMFMLLKFSEHESVGSQAVEICMPLDSGNVAQILYVGYGFKDQANW